METHWIVFVFSCLRPRLWRNWQSIAIHLQCAPLTARTTDALSFTVLPHTCSVLMQERMSLSVFSHSDIREPASAFSPCWREICEQKLNKKKKKNVFQCASVFEGVRTDLCQSLREAGRLSLWERQEEGLLPERSESWNITKRKEILKCNAAKSMKWTHGRHNCHVQHQKGGTESVLQVVADADDWSKQDGLLLLFLLRRLCAGLPAVPVFPVQNW